MRTAYRNDPEFQLRNLSKVEPAVQENRFSRMIDNDQVVGRNYQRLVSEGFKYVYEDGDPAETLERFRERSIGEIRDAMLRLFPDLALNSLGDPLAEGTFKFDKGDSIAFLYKNLSGGEKPRSTCFWMFWSTKKFDDTVFFIDEPETHMSTALQAALLKKCSPVPEFAALDCHAFSRHDAESRRAGARTSRSRGEGRRGGGGGGEREGGGGGGRRGGGGGEGGGGGGGGGGG